MAHLLRKAVCEDLPDVYAFELDYIREIEPEMEARWLAAIPRNLRQWIDNLPRMVVAVEGRQVIGYSFWEWDGDAAQKQAGVSSLYVFPMARRRGIGGELLRWCEQDAVASGAAWMQFGVKRHNPARLLYERAGYALVHEQTGYDIYRKELMRRSASRLISLQRGRAAT